MEVIDQAKLDEENASMELIEQAPHDGHDTSVSLLNPTHIL